ncbi:unnamed protein product [Heterobilharzia americana]|nr:unnamed protein product [Heterobilharzia americana]
MFGTYSRFFCVNLSWFAGFKTKLEEHISCTIAENVWDCSPHSNYMSYADMCRDITLVVDDLKLRNVCLVGHSMGGKAVMYAALTEPDKYDKLVVLDISPAPKPAAQSVLSLIDLMSSVDLEEMGRKCGNNAAVVRNTLMTDWKEPVPDSIVRGFLLTNLDERNGKLLWRVNLDAVRKFWQQISNFPNEKVNGHVFDRPALFIASSKGGYLDASDVPAIRNYFPQARILQIANTGHWVHFDAPNALISLITSFIQEESVNIKSFIDVTELQ